MNKLALFVLIVAAVGCKHNEFDVSPAQVTEKIGSAHDGPKGLPDLDHLPPGAVKNVQTFKKGDRMPDGTIADGDRKMVRVEMPADGTGNQKRMLVDDTVEEH